jgi:hypothetical protein
MQKRHKAPKPIIGLAPTRYYLACQKILTDDSCLGWPLV